MHSAAMGQAGSDRRRLNVVKKCHRMRKGLYPTIQLAIVQDRVSSRLTSRDCLKCPKFIATCIAKLKLAPKKPSADNVMYWPCVVRIS